MILQNRSTENAVIELVLSRFTPNVCFTMKKSKFENFIKAKRRQYF